MTDYLLSTGRETITDKAIARDLHGTDMSNKKLERLVAKRKRFTDCDFSHSQFDAAYLHRCVFDSCKFVGSKFMNSNLRGCKFEGCVFDYAEFHHTQVEPEILESGCPSQENLQQKFARTLRINFQQIGDSIAANRAIKIELEASRIHLYKAWRSREAYYRKHYPGILRIRSFLNWLEFVLLEAFWGNGESFIKLLRTVILVVFLIALGDVHFSKNPAVLSSYFDALENAPQVFLGISKPKEFPGLLLAGIAALRYVLLACLVSILVKRFSRR